MTRIPHLPSLYMIRKFTFLLLSSRHEHVFNFPFKMIVSKLKPLKPWGSEAKQMIWFSSKVVMSNLLIENVYNQVYCSWNDWFTIKWLKLLKMRMLWTQVSIVGKTTKAVGTGVVQGTKVGFLHLLSCVVEKVVWEDHILQNHWRIAYIWWWSCSFHQFVWKVTFLSGGPRISKKAWKKTSGHPPTAPPNHP